MESGGPLGDGSVKRWTPEEKLRLVLGSYEVDNVAAYCEQVGIDRSYLYALRRELESSALTGWSEKRVGRPAKGPEKDAGALEAELGQTREELAKAQEEAAKWEIRSELNAFYVRTIQEHLGKKKSSKGRRNRRGEGGRRR